jgi:hypothetical protein
MFANIHFAFSLVSHFAEGGIGEPYWVTLPLIDVSDDYQCQQLHHIFVAVYPRRKRLADVVECSGHGDYSSGS